MEKLTLDRMVFLSIITILVSDIRITNRGMCLIRGQDLKRQVKSNHNDFFMLEWLVSGSRQEMGKSTFGLALSAQLIDLPLLPKVQWHLVEKARFRLYFHWFGNYSIQISAS